MALLHGIAHEVTFEQRFYLSLRSKVCDSKDLKD